jgi:hypothetical protein
MKGLGRERVGEQAEGVRRSCSDEERSGLIPRGDSLELETSSELAVSAVV